MAEVRRRRRSREPAPSESAVWRNRAALCIFAFIVTAGPLAFGAVDRVFQIALVGVFAIGMLILPPAVTQLSARTNALILGGMALLLVKEFGPAAWFGPTDWRKTLSESYGVVFPWTHNPEPARALEALLTAAVAMLWLLWVRTLAMERDNRPVLAWTLFSAAVIVAAVSFATRGIDPLAIYGIRFTPGWVGFGPFPNRNHTGCFLAMGLVMGAGCIAWAGSRKNYPLIFTGMTLLGLVLAALLSTQSRGGLIVGVAGLVIFFGIVLLKFRDRRAFGVALGAALVLGALGLSFGAQVIGRFSAQGSGQVSNLMRVQIWQDTIHLWKTAPLFGHGLGSFTQLYPMYQELETGGRVVLHPESSWLQWLAELGAVSVLLGMGALFLLIAPRLKDLFSSQRSFFPRAAGLAAALTLLVHAAFDVPAHRWGTAGFALAALALACPPARGAQWRPASSKAALVPFAIAGFWCLPFIWDRPAWAPLSVTRLLQLNETSWNVPIWHLQRALSYFPLNGALHQAIGLRQLEGAPAPLAREWQQHFHIATRLAPGSWNLPAEQARACARRSPGVALHFWQKAIESAEHRADEVFRLALEETSQLPGAATTWSQYAESHPALLLTYAQLVPEATARAAYLRWWEDRGSVVERISDWEVETFYRLAALWGTREQLDAWMLRQRQLRKRDFRIWGRLLHGFGASQEAWELFAVELPDPVFPANAPRADRLQLEATWRAEPRNYVNARDYAQVLTKHAERDAAQQVILTVARFPDAPEWFIRKGAHLLATAGDIPAAVNLLLAERSAPAPPPPPAPRKK